MSNSVSGFPYDVIYSSSESIRNSLVKASNSKSKFANSVKGLIARLDNLVRRVVTLRREEDMLVTDIKHSHDLEVMKTLVGRIKSFNDGLVSIDNDFRTLHRDVSIVLECVQEENGETS